MAEREQAIIDEARVVLNDTNKTNLRWSDERLLKLLNEAQADLAKAVPLYTLKTTIIVSAGIEEYKLPDDCVTLLSVSYDGYVVRIASEEDMEELSIGWEDDIGCTISAVVVNELSQQTIRPYPLLSEQCDSVELRIRYHALPQPLESLEDELTLSNMWDNALTQYVIGKAFLDYGDESSISRANTAMSLYGKEYKQAQKMARKSFSKRTITTGYQGKVANSRFIGRRYGGCNQFRYN
jgi:hypothetical protein